MGAISEDETSTGLDPNLAALLTYLFGFLTGILFLVIEKRSSYVRFHAMQSTLTFISIFVLQWIAGALPLLGWLVSAALGVLSLVLWVMLMWKAFSGERYKLPVIGDYAEEHSGLIEN